MTNSVHNLTFKGLDGKTVAHPLYWVWHAKKKAYPMCRDWEDSALEFYDWCLSNGWKRGDSIRRHDPNWSFNPTNCYVHVRGTPLGQEK